MPPLLMQTTNIPDIVVVSRIAIEMHEKLYKRQETIEIETETHSHWTQYGTCKRLCISIDGKCKVSHLGEVIPTKTG